MIKQVQSYLRIRKEARRLRKWANSPPMKNAATLIDEIYNDINGMQISKDAREVMAKQDDTLLYGEAVLYSFADLLAITSPSKDEVFYDLGSGVGKPVFMAALLHDFESCTGIELLAPLDTAAKTALDRFNNTPTRATLYPDKTTKIQFVNEDILTADFSDADVIFLNGTAFFGIIWQRIIEKLLNLKPGCRIIVTTKCLDENHFELIHHDGHLMSWGLAAVSVYKKIR